MSSILSKSIITGAFFLFILVSGYLLSRLGKPYNGLVFNIHKLVGLAAGVFLIVTVVNAQKASPLQPAAILVIIVTALIFLLLVAAGGLLSVIAAGGLNGMQPALQTTITWVHKISPYFAVAGSGVVLYMLLGR
jgi:hypothetical protein